MSYWKIIIPRAFENLVTNPSFETGATGYTASGGNGISQSVIGRYGAYSLQCTYVDTLTFYTYPITLTAVSHTYAADIYIPSNWDGGAISLGVSGFTSAVTTTSTTASTTGQWTRIFMTVTPDAGDLTGNLTVTTASAATATRYILVDGVDCGIANARMITHCDGDMPGCAWVGAAHSSTSIRPNGEARGGELYDLRDDLNFTPVSWDGTGMPKVNNLFSELTLQPGNLYEGQTIGERLITLTGLITGSSHVNLHTKKQTLIKALNSSTGRIIDFPQPRTFRYTGATVEKEFYAVYDGGLSSGRQAEKGFALDPAIIKLRADDPLYYQVGNTSAILDAEDTATYRLVLGRVDGIWSALGPPAAPGTAVYTDVRTVCELDGSLYIGGDFQNFDNSANADYIVRYNIDLNTYAAVAALNGIVYSIVPAPDGASLYIGGEFTNAGGVANADYFAVYNTVTNTWSALGSGGTAAVRAIAVDSTGQIYIGGSFTNWAAVADADYIAKWDGSAWVAVGATHFTNAIYAVAIDSQDKPYVGGLFSTIKKWTGSSWVTFGTITYSGTDVIYALHITPSGWLYAGGSIDTIDGVTVANIARIPINSMGSVWEPLADGVNGAVWSITQDSDGNLWVGGEFSTAGVVTAERLAIYNGSTWSAAAVGFATSPTIYTIHTSGENIFVGTPATGTILTGGQVVVAYGGTERAYPKFTMKRSGGTSATLKHIFNLTTGARLFFDYALLDGETITIDTTPGKQTIESSFFGTRWTALQPDSDFGQFYLTPGNDSGTYNNTIICYVARVGGPTLTGTMTWRDAYISED